MLLRVLEAVRDAGLRRAVVVTGYQAAAVRAAVEGAREVLQPLDVGFAHQPEQRGTGDAAARALEGQAEAGTVLVLYADTPLVQSAEVAGLVRAHAGSGAAATLLTARVPDPRGYGRIVRDRAGRVRAVVEERDATPAERGIDEINTGIGCFEAAALRSALARCRPANAQGEVYLTDAVAMLAAEGLAVQTVSAADAESVLGVNDRRGLAHAEARLRTRTLERWMDQGVTVVDPRTTYVEDDCVLAPDTVLWPMTVIRAGSRVGRGCQLGPGAHVEASELGDGVRVWYSVVEGSRVGAGCRIGPFSHLRPGTELDERVEVGNFAELKNARVGAGTRQHHHSYVGDADLGRQVNVGAGVITVNYDGARKHRTRVGDGAFLGCNANLVAPVEVGAGGYVAAGSTVTEAVPADALAIARARQVVKPGWAARRRAAQAPPDGDR